jgi:hypothetical protein
MTYRDVSQLTGIPVEKLLTMEQPERDRLSQIIVRCLHLLTQQQQQQQQSSSSSSSIDSCSFCV